jgi:hypothetical protein
MFSVWKRPNFIMIQSQKHKNGLYAKNFFSAISGLSNNLTITAECLHDRNAIASPHYLINMPNKQPYIQSDNR